MRAGLAFTGLNANAPLLGEIDTDNDGVLTAMEVLNLDLAGTQLVVLSACETGLGEIHEGEGVYGLRRSFQEAGVSNVVNSFWEVSDAGTQLLMTKFYAKFLGGKIFGPHYLLTNSIFGRKSFRPQNFLGNKCFDRNFFRQKPASKHNFSHNLFSAEKFFGVQR